MKEPIPQKRKRFYRFGPFRLFRAERELFRDDQPVDLPPKALDALLLLVSHRGHVVSKEQFMTTLWPGAFVEEDNLVQQISHLRKALGDGPEEKRYIETVARRGYRFTAEVTDSWEEEQAEPLLEVVDGGVAPELANRGARRHRLLVGALGALCVALAGLALLFWVSGPEATEPSRQVRRFTLTFDHPIVEPRVSPNGRYIAYIKPAGAYLGEPWLHDIQRNTRSQVAATNGAEDPFWSPDSRFLGYGDIAGPTGSGGSGRLLRFDVQEDRSSPICSLIERRVHGSAWSSDGAHIALGIGFLGAGGGSNVYNVPAESGELQPCLEFGPVEAETSRGLDYPVLVPSTQGDRVIARQTENRSSIVLSPDGAPVDGPELGFVHAFDPAGFLITTREGGRTSQVWAAPFDPETLQFPANPFLVAEAAAFPSVDSQGTLVYLDSQPHPIQLSWRDRAGRELGAIGQPQDSIYFPALSPDGRQVATTLGNDRSPTLRGDIWLHQTDQPLALRLTFDPDQHSFRPVWSPDSRRVAFGSWRDDSLEVFVQEVSGRGGVTPLVTTPGVEDLAHDWSADGRFLVFHKKPETGPNRDLWYLEFNAEGDWEERPLLQTPFEERVAVFSPDGAYIAYVSNESGQDEIYVTRFPSGESRWRVSKSGGTQPRWKNSGEIFFVQGDTLFAASVSTEAGFSAGTAVKLFADPALAAVWPAQQYDVTTDGQRFVLRETTKSAGPATLHVVQNWYEEFRDREQD